MNIFSHPKAHYYYLVILLLVTFLSLYKGVTVSFSSDDYVHLQHNIHYKSLGEALEVFTNPYGREYRPLVRLSLWLNHQMGDTAIPYKLSNIAMHLLCVLLVYLMMLRLGIEKIAALMGVSFFALHPIHTTSIHFILGRTDLVAAVFYLAALTIVSGWSARISTAQYLLASVFTIAALCSKELSVTLPVMMLAIIALKNRHYSLRAIISDGLKLWPFVLMVLVYVIARLYLWRNMPEAINVYTDFSVSNIITNYGEWMFGLLYPFDLYIAHEWLYQHRAAFIGMTVIALIMINGFLWWVLGTNKRQFMRDPLLWLGIGWILVTLIPMTGGNAHRWYLYVPSVGIVFVIVSLWTHVLTKHRQLLAVVFALVLSVYVAETIRQSIIWHKQSELAENFLREFEQQGLHKKERVTFANVPFGYQGAFLFSHNSLQEVLQVRNGYFPVVRVLSYLNIDDQTDVGVNVAGDTITFSISPTAFQYFMLSASERRFDNLGSRDVHGYKLDITELNPGGRILHYKITSGANAEPIYYFDGSAIRHFDSAEK